MLVIAISTLELLFVIPGRPNSIGSDIILGNGVVQTGTTHWV